MKLHVANFSPRVNEERIKKLFGQFGEVKLIELQMQEAFGWISGQAIVEMANGDALAAVRVLNGRAFYKRRLYVTVMQKPFMLKSVSSNSVAALY